MIKNNIKMKNSINKITKNYNKMKFIIMKTFKNNNYNNNNNKMYNINYNNNKTNQNLYKMT